MTTPKRSHVTARAVYSGGMLRVGDLDRVALRAGLRQMGLGDGEELIVRIERPDDAYTAGQVRAYWGFVIGPLHRWSGHARNELHAMFKAALLDEGKTSLTQLSREEMDTFLREAEVLAREECPDAFADPIHHAR